MTVTEGTRLAGSGQAPVSRRRSRRDPAARNQWGLLPQPPDNTEKYLYARTNLWVLTCFSVISFGCMVASEIGLLSATPWFFVFVPPLAFTIAYYLISRWVHGFNQTFDISAHRALVKSWQPERHPTVDVFLPVAGEPIEVLHNTWTHVARLRDHYPGEVTPYVLDDSNSPQLAQMAVDFGFVYGTRNKLGWFKKAGNLQFGFRNSDSDYILILDADFAPRPDLLNEMLPYLEADPRLGIVQSPQFFRILDSQNWIERGAGAVQELFYRTVQVSRQRNDGAICVGSCAVYRRAALEENGGTTLIGHSEDVHTGFDLRRLGWDLQYIPVALATGVCPDNVGGFFNQQYRWCTGSMSLLGSKKFWQTKLRPVTRACYLSGFFYYIHTALFTVVSPLVPIVLLLARPDLIRWQNTALVLPGLLYATVVFPLWHRNPYRLEAWAARMMYGWAHVFAIWDIVRRNRMAWQPTGSSGAKKNKTRRFWIAVIAWGGGTALLWVLLSIWRMLTMGPLNFALVLASGLFYATIVGRVLVQPRPTEAV